MPANSEKHAVELVNLAAAPRILEGNKAVIDGRTSARVKDPFL